MQATGQSSWQTRPSWDLRGRMAWQRRVSRAWEAWSMTLTHEPKTVQAVSSPLRKKRSPIWMKRDRSRGWVDGMPIVDYPMGVSGWRIGRPMDKIEIFLRGIIFGSGMNFILWASVKVHEEPGNP